MNKRLNQLIVVILTSTCLNIGGVAEEETPKGQNIDAVKERIQREFNKIDSDGDQGLSQDEFSAMQKKQAAKQRKDRRGPENRQRDRRRSDASKGEERRQRDDRAAAIERREAMFAIIDKDGDGSISREEDAARDETLRNHRRTEEFNHMDANSDGKIDVTEFGGERLVRLKKADLNEDGIVERSELRELRKSMRESNP